ncbi:hypothetical protein [Mycolicibacterium sp. HK-90]|uniref:hypothetical protein n=1 Tax=Mycolicibacterium sp. HK-90 TaxID=3056937 RepID=UPI0026597090|nr:hypothetical protein [Mycolicibacterium sp. HK-90]WKG05519.1 hypothetical protein QU592_10755 [Mycolicibacterium sp. HK-90]
MGAAALTGFISFAAAPIAWTESPGEAFCTENARHLQASNGEMPFEVDEAVAWLTQKFNMSETEAVRLIDNVGKTYWSGMNGRWEVRCHDQ